METKLNNTSTCPLNPAFGGLYFWKGEKRMTTKELNSELYKKMQEEMNQYIDWLKGLPTDDILNHTYEYTVKQDILFALDNYELTDEECKALLSSQSPLNDVYEHYNNLETGYMQDLEYCLCRVSHMLMDREKIRDDGR